MTELAVLAVEMKEISTVFIQHGGRPLAGFETMSSMCVGGMEGMCESLQCRLAGTTICGSTIEAAKMPLACRAIEESNALALAIVPSGKLVDSISTNSGAVQEKAFDPTGWELALVTDSNTNSSTVESQLAGGFDKLILDSLYDEASYRQQQQQQQQYYAAPAHYGAPASNPFMTADPFAVSNQVATPPAVQMAAMAQQQSLMMQSNPFTQPVMPQHQQPILMGGAANPFVDNTGFGNFPVSNTQHQNNPFGSTRLL
ncbi:Putative clathrin assembly protein [Apostasia shenzhenica]|uniref:Clathrin assembly protein n=1 Tax=Apostasia shenzhenica TaxID=1088818 RepID=A0A2I0AVU8_9ASPA|nr:Putative clathrin assembly protein [Apostasia shenzhenica]